METPRGFMLKNGVGREWEVGDAHCGSKEEKHRKILGNKSNREHIREIDVTVR